MKTFEERYTAWVDGKLPPSEVPSLEREMAEHGVTSEDADDMRLLGRMLREHPPAPPLPYADVFQHRLLHEIERDARDTRRDRREAFDFSSLRQSLASCFASPMRTFATAIVALIAVSGMWISYGSLRDHHDDTYFALVLDTRPGDSGIQARTVWTPKDNVTVVWLEGLDDLPADYVLE